MILTEVTKCFLCGARFVSNHPRIMGEAAVLDRQKRMRKGRSPMELLEAYLSAEKNGQALHLEPQDRALVTRIMTDMKRNREDTILRLQEGTYE